MQEAAKNIRDNVDIDMIDFTKGTIEPDDSNDVDDSFLVNMRLNEDDTVNTAVSVDGPWQRRGYASLNGLVTAISIDNGKCLTYECLIKKSKLFEQ